MVCSVQVHAQSPPQKETSASPEDPVSPDKRSASADKAEALFRPEQLSVPADSSQISECSVRGLQTLFLQNYKSGCVKEKRMMFGKSLISVGKRDM